MYRGCSQARFNTSVDVVLSSAGWNGVNGARQSHPPRGWYTPGTDVSATTEHITVAQGLATTSRRLECVDFLVNDCLVCSAKEYVKDSLLDLLVTYLRSLCSSTLKPPKHKDPHRSGSASRRRYKPSHCSALEFLKLIRSSSKTHGIRSYPADR